MRAFLLSLGLLLAATAAYAQQPTLPGPPQPGTPPPTAVPPVAPALPAEVLGQTYSVELKSGTSFTGRLQTITGESLTFSTRELGVVTVQRSNLRQYVQLTQSQVRRGLDYVGNGTRMFFAPTARNLRKGEGYVQDINVFLVGANYGITDNFSFGLLVPIIPIPTVFVVAATPKVSVPVTEKFNVGAGVLYVVATAFGHSGSAGVGYGLATYGTADSNVTFGLGYGFAGGDVSSSPVAVVGGNLRVSRRLFVVNETYIASGGLGGLLGVRVAASRASGSLGLLYSNSRNINGDLNGNFTPAYFEFAYRLGKVTQRGGQL